MSRRYFGTDGIRGRVGEEPITAEFVLKLGWAIGTVFARNLDRHRDRLRVLIGKDTRISGYMFESALEAGLVAAGMHVRLLGPMPTPAVAYLTRTFHASAGIVISASHNAYQDNGIKFFSSRGTKLPDSLEEEIEAELEMPMITVDSASLGQVKRIDDALGRYIEFCKSTYPLEDNLAGLKIVLDCAHGATYQVAPAVLRELDADVQVIGVAPDGLNINDQVGSTYPAALQRAVRAHRAHLGIAFDGDGDRVIFVDHLGEVVDGDELLLLMAADQKLRNGQCAGVAGTLMSNLGLEIALRDLDIPFARANVGDRFVQQLMRERGWSLGGESSGHIICAEATTTGDGIVAALQVLAALRHSGKNLHELKKTMRKLPQKMINVRIGNSVDLEGNESIRLAVEQIESELAGGGRVLLRPSGTEPVVRVMVEGEDSERVAFYAEQLAKAVGDALQ